MKYLLFTLSLIFIPLATSAVELTPEQFAELKEQIKAEVLQEISVQQAKADSMAQTSGTPDSIGKNGRTVWLADASSLDYSHMDNDVVPILDKSGFGVRTKAGDFLFKPYALIHTAATFNYYDDEGLTLSEVDRVFNSGFSIPNAIIGISGKAFNRLTFNIAINAAKTGGDILQQAWFDVFFFESLRLKAGKFKTPFTHGYLSTMGQTLFPELPYSMTKPVRTNLSLDAVQPHINTGFDLGSRMTLDFADQLCLLGVVPRSQIVVQRGDQLAVVKLRGFGPQIGERTLLDQNTVCCLGVVMDQQHAVGSHVDVELRPVSLDLYRIVEGTDRIPGRILGIPVPAVGNHSDLVLRIDRQDGHQRQGN